MKKALLVLCALMGFEAPAFSQSWCATPFQSSKLPASVYTTPAKGTEAGSTNRTTANTTCYYVRVFFHLVRNSNGSGGQPVSVIPQEMAFLRAAYAPQQIYFVNAGFDEIRNDNFTNNIDQNKYNTIINTQVISNALNVYLLDNSSNFNSGLANDNPGRAVVIGGAVAGQNLTPSPVVAHELGHCLGLYHTFETALGRELVNGTNCSSAGDLVCDTPAESPAYNFTENSNCAFTTNFQDSNGAIYNPDLRNVMDYVRPSCLEHFTVGQTDRIKTTIANSNMLAAFATTTAINPTVQGATAFDCSSAYTVNTSSGNVQWSTSDASIATIDASTGVATATGRGNVTFTATVSDFCNTVSGSISAQVGNGIVGTYNYNQTYATLQGTNFIQRNGNSVYVRVSLNTAYNYTFTCSNPDIHLNSSTTETLFTIPNTLNNSFKIFATTTNPGCSISTYWIFVPNGYGYGYGYMTAPNPANSEVVISETPSDSEVSKNEVAYSSKAANSLTSSEPFTVVVYDNYGRKVKSQVSNQGKAVVNTLDLPNGLYTIKVGEGKNSYSNHIQVIH